MKYPSLFASLLLPLVSLASVTPTPTAAPTVPRITHPGAGQVFYFVLTDRFANGDTGNDEGGYKGDVMAHGFDAASRWRYHGGDFKGLTANLDYLKGLGVTTLWITPPFVNQVVQNKSSGYHGYWILDFTAVDPHLGTDAEFRTLVAEVHARGLKLFLDIVANHTGDIIAYENGALDYIGREQAPTRDAKGQPFDETQYAYNGIEPAPVPPELSVETSFARRPLIAPGLEHAKKPEWLNNPLNYHNRGNSTFRGENSLFGDFVGLDDVATERKEVVNGFIDVYNHWIRAYGIDGYRIDTVKHANQEFWQAFSPAIRETARQQGKPFFFQLGEVQGGNARQLSDFSVDTTMDATLDFAFNFAVREWVSRGKGKAVMETLFRDDDFYVRHDGNVHLQGTFLGNHDDGRIGGFLVKDNPGADDATLLALSKLSHGLMLFSRGQPVLYYGDEQGMRSVGDDTLAREDMFPSQTPEFKDLPLIGSKRTGASEKFDTQHPLYRTIAELSRLRRSHAALAYGATWTRENRNPSLLAFSRIERDQRIEYVAVFNSSRTETVNEAVPTSQADGATWTRLYASDQSGEATAHSGLLGALSVSIKPLQFALWRADKPLDPAGSPLGISLQGPAGGTELKFTTYTKDFQTFPVREALTADVTGANGLAEVTFALERASHPGEYEILGTDDAPPFRVFWRPPAELQPGETFALVATASDLRGHTASTRIDGLTIAKDHPTFGIARSSPPHFNVLPPAEVSVAQGQPLKLQAGVAGTAPFAFAWYRDGVAIAGATSSTLEIASTDKDSGGRYTVSATNRSGTTLSRATVVSVAPASPSI